MAADPLTKNTVSDLLNYDVSDDDDPFKDIDRALQVRDDKTTLSPRAAKRKAEHDKENDILGLDEEVKITKKRKPIAKLDETRLLSQPGIPKLRALARSGQLVKKLRLKGKGHEFSDAAKLLNYYQLWLDNLYPRAKFADGLQLVEKAGHSKRMQTMRKEWINEGKPGYAREVRNADRDINASDAGENAGLPRDADGGRSESRGEATTARPPLANQSMSGDRPGANDDLFFPDTNKTLRDDDDSDNAMPEEDELDALLAEQQQDATRASRPELAGPESDGDDDDLDALLAEQEPKVHDRDRNMVGAGDSDEDDDLDALLAEHDVSKHANERAKAHQKKADDEDDDLGALLAGNESSEVADRDGKVPPLSSPCATIDEDQEDSQPLTRDGA